MVASGPFSLVVSDVDGTLVTSGSSAPSHRLINVVREIRACGAHVILATARDWSQTRRLVRNLDLEGELVICDRGLQIVQADSGSSDPTVLMAWGQGIPDKGPALSWVQRHLGVSAEQTIALGDGEGDEPLLLRAGYRIAVAPCAQGLVALAQEVVSDPVLDGAAGALERLLAAGRIGRATGPFLCTRGAL